MKIAQILQLEPQQQALTVQGWVRTFRANRFIALNDGSCLGNLQCVIDFEQTEESLLKKKYLREQHLASAVNSSPAREQAKR